LRLHGCLERFRRLSQKRRQAVIAHGAKKVPGDLLRPY